MLPVGRVLWPTRWRILPIFLSSIRGHVEQPVGIGQRFGTTIVGRVGMKNVIIDPEKDTQPMRFARVRRYLKVIVEIAAKRRIPRAIPALARLVRLSFSNGAREISTNCVPRAGSIDKSANAFTNPVQPSHPFSHVGSNMK